MMTTIIPHRSCQNGSQLHAESIDTGEACINKIIQSYTKLAQTSPFDTIEKIEQAIPLWHELYEIVGFTTVDHDTEHFASTLFVKKRRRCC